MTAQANILFVDDEANILHALKRAVRAMDVEVYTAESAEQALTLLEKEAIDVIISDKKMPGTNGMELLQRVAEEFPEIVRLMLTAHTEIDDLIELVNKGKIWGYLQKPWDNTTLRITIEQALQTRDLFAERSLLRHTLEKYQGQKKRNFQKFIGDSMAMQFVYNAIEQCSPSRASVFVTGQSGTGKELVAHAIHALSPRKEQELVCLNCAAIPSELMESEIFGHVKGAFSGAVSNRDGAASLADGGTLFLDEIGEMDISLQAKILRFIQTGTFQKVGSSKTEKVDVRFICATNREPMQAIEEKLLREDLYYRLNVISIDLPPLAEREKDPLQIADYFLNRYSKLEDKMFVGFSQEAQSLINHYHWPGNVRQLQNTIHSAVVMSEGPLLTEVTMAQQLKLKQEEVSKLLKRPLNRAMDTPVAQVSSAVDDNAETPHSVQIIPLAEVEKAAIERAIQLCDDNVVKAASMLEVSPSTLYRKIQNWTQD